MAGFMSGSKTRFLELTARQRRVAHELLAEVALIEWQAYAEARGTIRYSETVCGTRQIVDAQLPADAMASVSSGEGTMAVAERYLEPIVAIYDDDLELPDTVEFAYYAIYNYFRKYAMSQEIDDWLIVNQALASQADQDAWLPLLSRAIDAAREAG